MIRQLLSLLECPHCGQPLDMSVSLWEEEGRAFGRLDCPCAAWPIVDGIPIVQLNDRTSEILAALDRHDAAAARRLALDITEEGAAALADAGTRVGRGLRAALRRLVSPSDAAYFGFRFGDPTFVVTRTIAERLLLATAPTGRPALDVCGGCGHLSWALAARSVDLGLPPPVLADGSFRLAWLATRFVAPGASALVCNADWPLPVRSGAFGLVACADAFHYIWNRRSLAAELLRAAGEDGVALVTHVHNLTAWSPSQGMPLAASAYRRLFARAGPRLLGDLALLRALVRDACVSMAGSTDDDLVDEPSLTIVAGPVPDQLPSTPWHVVPAGTWIVHPLYAIASDDGEQVTLRLAFPSAFYEDEYGTLAREYLAEELRVPRALLDAPHTLATVRPDLVNGRVLIDVPPGIND
jgi:uncharacterized protein YbaR (Trm112 family)